MSWLEHYCNMKYFNSLSFDMKKSLFCVTGMVNIEVLWKNQLARLRSIIHHKSHHEMTYFALYLFALLSHFTTLPHLTSDWVSVLWRLPAPAPDWAPSVGAGSGLDCDKQQARPTLGENRPKLQSQWRHLYPTLSSINVPLQSSYFIHDAWLCVSTY